MTNKIMVSVLMAMVLVPATARADRTVSQTVDKRDLSGGERTDEYTRAWTEKNGCIKDDAGHIIGNALGGENSVNNMMPLDLTLNRGAYSRFEAEVKKLVQEYGEADVFVTLHYNSSISKTRPSAITYVAKADAVPAQKLSAKTLTKKFDNPLPSDWKNPCVCEGVLNNAQLKPKAKC